MAQGSISFPKPYVRLVKKSSTAEAELIREAIDRLLGEEPPARKPRLGVFDSGDPSFAERSEASLAEGFGRDGVDW